MTQQIIDTGSTANDGTGDPIRTAFQKTNDNFTELYNASAVSVTGNVTGGNVSTSGLVTATGNITGGNLRTSGSVSTGGLTYSGLEVISPNYITVSGTGQTSSLSTTTSQNILLIGSTGYTHTVNMPTSPVDGQITRFAVSGNTVTLVVGTGTVTPTFAGSTTAGTAYKYTYRVSNTTWYRS
jgi:hypothetical protein